MKEVMFLLPSPSCNGYCAGGLLIGKEELFDKDFIIQRLETRNLYFAQQGKEFVDIKSMSVEQFEKFFTKEEIAKLSHLLDYDSSKGFRNSVFRKEVTVKWGTDLCPKEIKTAKKLRKLEFGHVYVSDNGKIQWLYLGNLTVNQNMNGVDLTEVSGNCFICLNKDKSVEDNVLKFFTDLAVLSPSRRDSHIRQHFLKGIKSVIEDNGEFIAKSDLEKLVQSIEYDYNGFYRNEHMSIRTEIRFN